MAVDYGKTKCKLKSCRKVIIRQYHNPNKKFCKRSCYTKWMRGRKAKKYQKRKKNLKEKICHGIRCRGEKKFIQQNGEHYCHICRDAMKDYGDEISVVVSRR
jgi:hypothetical protein